MEKKKVSIYVLCHYKYDTKKGYSQSVMVYKNKFKIFYDCYDREKERDNKNTTSNRCLIYGVIHCMKRLKEPCLIDLYVPSLLGFNSRKSINKDLIEQVKEIEKEGQHELNVIVDPIETKKVVYQVAKINEINK